MIASEVGAVEDVHSISLEPVWGVEVVVSSGSARVEDFDGTSIGLEDAKDFCLSLGLGPSLESAIGSFRRLMLAEAG